MGVIIDVALPTRPVSTVAVFTAKKQWGTV